MSIQRMIEIQHYKNINLIDSPYRDMDEKSTLFLSLFDAI